METGGKIEKFEYVMSITKIVGNDTNDLIICGAPSNSAEDFDGEFVDQGSLRKAWNQYLKNPVIRLMHDSKIGAIGRVIDEYTDSDGVTYKTNFDGNEPFIVAKISNAADLDSIRTKIREQVYAGLSIGGRGRSIKKNGKTTLMIKSLLEISVVDIPSSKNSFLTVIKNKCTGDNCPIQNTELQEESKKMEQNEIVEIVTKTIKEMKEADELSQLRKDYETLKADVAKSANTEVKTEPVEKSLADQVAELTATIETMKTTPIAKGVQDGEEPVEKGATDITSAIVSRHYGGK